METEHVNICLRSLAVRGENKQKTENTGWARVQIHVRMMVW